MCILLILFFHHFYVIASRAPFLTKYYHITVVVNHSPLSQRPKTYAAAVVHQIAMCPAGLRKSPFLFILLFTPMPQDFSDDWQDLDDLLEGAQDGQLEGVDVENSTSPRSASGAQNSPKTTFVGDARLDAKLREVDALLTSEAASIAEKNEAGTDAELELAEAEVNKVMAAFLGGEGERGGPSGTSLLSMTDGHLGDEEKRLMQMVSARVRARARARARPAGHDHIANSCVRLLRKGPVKICG